MPFIFDKRWNFVSRGQKRRRPLLCSEDTRDQDSGRQITLFESMSRNLIRIVDYLPSMYIVGIITILISKKNKRLVCAGSPLR
jgi:hypothetical protein